MIPPLSDHLKPSTVSLATQARDTTGRRRAQVVCGYHTWAQVTVGMGLGAAMARGWMAVGALIDAHVPARAG